VVVLKAMDGDIDRLIVVRNKNGVVATNDLESYIISVVSTRRRLASFNYKSISLHLISLFSIHATWNQPSSSFFNFNNDKNK